MKVLYLANPLMGGTGGDRRSFEVLQRVGQHGIDPVIVVDEFVLEKMKSEGNPLCRRHKIYSIKRPNVIYDRYFRSASRAALDYFSIYETAKVIAKLLGPKGLNSLFLTMKKQISCLKPILQQKKLTFLGPAFFSFRFFRLMPQTFGGPSEAHAKSTCMRFTLGSTLLPLRRCRPLYHWR